MEKKLTPKQQLLKKLLQDSIKLDAEKLKAKESKKNQPIKVPTQVNQKNK